MRPVALQTSVSGGNFAPFSINHRKQTMRNFLSNHKARVSALTMAMIASAMTSAHAAGIDDALGAVDLSGIAVKVGAAALVIVGIALAFKGPDVAKRVVKKV